MKEFKMIISTRINAPYFEANWQNFVYLRFHSFTEAAHSFDTTYNVRNCNTQFVMHNL